MKRLTILMLALSLVLSGCTIAVTSNNPGLDEQELLTGQNYQVLFDLMKTASQSYTSFNNWRGDFIGREEMAEADNGAPQSDASVRQGGDYSQTNIQVEGVDEADIIKTDGEYLYVIANHRVYIVNASNPASLSVVSSVSFNPYVESENKISGQDPIELYLDRENERLTLIVSAYKGEVFYPEPYYPEPVDDDKPEDDTDQTEQAGNDVGSAPGSGGGSDAVDPVAPDTPVDSDQDSNEDITGDDISEDIDPDSVTGESVSDGFEGSDGFAGIDTGDQPASEDQLTEEEVQRLAEIEKREEAARIEEQESANADSGFGDSGAAIDLPMPQPDIDIAYPDIWYPYSREQFVSTLVYDISDKSNPRLVRQFSQEGNYLTSRKIGPDVYVISNTYQYWIMTDFMSAETDGVLRGDSRESGTAEDTVDLAPETVFPAISEGDPNGDWKTVPAGKIAIVPDGNMAEQTTLAAFNTIDTDQEADVLSIIGSSGMVYASSGNLYVAAWQPETASEEDTGSDDDTTMPYMQSFNTTIYRYRIDNATIRPAGKGTVPGTVINQFSMDEYEGYFRIAATTGWIWDESNPSKNHVYVLDENLKIVGQVNNLAPGEEIKSVRFMGDKSYVVTFRTVDPLFVIDLTNPSSPVVLGELKIPGYSTYLHPFSENLLLGFGYDVVEAENEWVYHGGLKIALFDISDFNNPREHSTLILGGSGSYSELLYNHKALLFDRERKIIAFPAMLTEAVEGQPGRGFYNRPVFQGLIVLTTDDQDKLVLKGHVSHMSEKETKDIEKYYYGYDQIQRAATIGETLFTFSPRLIHSFELNSLEKTGSVELPGYEG